MNANPRLMLESHYFFRPFKVKWVGWGPFVAIQPGTSEIIQSAALGFMVGFKYSDEEPDSRSWNIGLGLAVEPSAKTFDGLQENSPISPGEQIRFKERLLFGVLAVFSFGF